MKTASASRLKSQVMLRRNNVRAKKCSFVIACR
jgi:hypothetical protein